ncbi:MAG: DUF1295 domain-containing protein [Solirubrobacterales bacterium]|nr:DUF1295 domain-containing protein [Solirubrobacterales bacterium]
MAGNWLIVAGACAVAALATMIAVGYILRRLGRVAVMDVLWGPLVLVLSTTAAVTGLILGTAGVQVWILVAVVALWAWRLARHIGTRFGSDVEDPRYEELMKKPAASLLRSVLLPQGAVAWVISLPVQAAAISRSLSWPVLVIGILVALAGLIIETIADRQLERFRGNGGPGRIMDRGLWSWSRHPNYFGESVIWWGVWIAAAAAWPGILTVISPALMTFVLVRGTGVRLMEEHMKGRTGWDEYAARTSIFIPWPPRNPGRGHEQ